MRFTDVASCNFTLWRGITGHVDVRGKVWRKITESRGIDHYSKIGRGDFDCIAWRGTFEGSDQYGKLQREITESCDCDVRQETTVENVDNHVGPGNEAGTWQVMAVNCVSVKQHQAVKVQYGAKHLGADTQQLWQQRSCKGEDGR